MGLCKNSAQKVCCGDDGGQALAAAVSGSIDSPLLWKVACTLKFSGCFGKTVESFHSNSDLQTTE